MADSSVDIRRVVKRHGATLAVDHLSLDVRKGEFFSILGPSGSGKTTILRLLAGFDQPDEGEILIEGRSMHQVPPNLRPVNLVFQSYALFPHLTVFGNIAFGLEMRRVARREIGPRVEAALEMVRLTGKQNRLPSELSGGEQQRVAVARALVNRPAVVLLDEPLGALDQQLRQEMQVELKTIHEQVGLTFVYVTHHQEEALTMSDRVAVMDRGRLLQVGTPRDVYESPASPFVAGFIGISNSLAGRIEAVRGEQCVIRPMHVPTVSPVLARSPAHVRDGSRVVLLIRPERLRLSGQRGAGGFENELPAQVSKAVYNGSETQYLLRLSDTVSWKVRVPNSGGDQKLFLAGDPVFLHWNADESVVLNE